MAAADAAGMPIGAWVEQALRQTLEAPAAVESVEIDELEAMVRRVVAEKLQPVTEALARPEAATPNPPAGCGASVTVAGRRQLGLPV